MSAWAGGNAVNAVPVAAHSRFHAQKTTPKATPRTAVTTMSTVRQRLLPDCGSTDSDERTACSAMSPPDSLRRHDPDQVRGSAVSRTLSAEALPCRMCSVVLQSVALYLRNLASSASPSGTPRPVQASQPVPAE